jgi:hypothetical protein
MGFDFQWFVAKVVDRENDETQSGKIKIRILGVHDDETNIPDDKLPWAYPVAPITSPSTDRLGAMPVGVTANSTVVGFWIDKDRQIPMVFGTIYRSQKPKSEEGGGAVA